MHNVEKRFSDISSINQKDKVFAKDINVLAKSNENDLTTRQKALLYIPNTEIAKFSISGWIGTSTYIVVKFQIVIRFILNI